MVGKWTFRVVDQHCQFCGHVFRMPPTCCAEAVADWKRPLNRSETRPVLGQAELLAGVSLIDDEVE